MWNLLTYIAITVHAYPLLSNFSNTENFSNCIIITFLELIVIYLHNNVVFMDS